MKEEIKSPCCNVPLRLSISTRWGRRLLCSHCGRDKNGKKNKYETKEIPQESGD